MDAPSKYGRAAARNAELPAAPAANTNGKIGRQQLDAANTLPIAAIPASAPPAVGSVFVLMSILLNDGPPFP